MSSQPVSRSEQSSCLSAENCTRHKNGGATIVVALTTIALMGSFLLLLAQNGYNLAGINAIAKLIDTKWIFLSIGIASTILLLDAAYIAFRSFKSQKTEEQNQGPSAPHTPISSTPSTPPTPSTPRRVTSPERESPPQSPFRPAATVAERKKAAQEAHEVVSLREVVATQKLAEINDKKFVWPCKINSSHYLIVGTELDAPVKFDSIEELVEALNTTYSEFVNEKARRYTDGRHLELLLSPGEFSAVLDDEIVYLFTNEEGKLKCVPTIDKKMAESVGAKIHVRTKTFYPEAWVVAHRNALSTQELSKKHPLEKGEYQYLGERSLPDPYSGIHILQVRKLDGAFETFYFKTKDDAQQKQQELTKANFTDVQARDAATKYIGAHLLDLYITTPNEYWLEDSAMRVYYREGGKVVWEVRENPIKLDEFLTSKGLTKQVGLEDEYPEAIVSKLKPELAAKELLKRTFCSSGEFEHSLEQLGHLIYKKVWIIIEKKADGTPAVHYFKAQEAASQYANTLTSPNCQRRVNALKEYVERAGAPIYDAQSSWTVRKSLLFTFEQSDGSGSIFIGAWSATRVTAFGAADPLFVPKEEVQKKLRGEYKDYQVISEKDLLNRPLDQKEVDYIKSKMDLSHKHYDMKENQYKSVDLGPYTILGMRKGSADCEFEYYRKGSEAFTKKLAELQTAAYVKKDKGRSFLK